MSAIQLSSERLVDDLKRVARDADDLVHATAGAVGEKAHEYRGRMTDAVQSAKRTCSRVEEKVVEGAKSADKAIRVHPYQSIGAALGLGLLIGAWVSRRKNKS